MSGQLDYEINKELGECYLFMGDLDKAEEYYGKAVTSNGIHADPYLGLATIAVQRGDLDKAMSARFRPRRTLWNLTRRRSKRPVRAGNNIATPYPP